jgi:hypothetical protein
MVIRVFVYSSIRVVGVDSISALDTTGWGLFSPTNARNHKEP